MVLTWSDLSSASSTNFFAAYANIRRHDAKIVTFLCDVRDVSILLPTYPRASWRHKGRHILIVIVFYYMYRALVHILRVPTGTKGSTTLYYNRRRTTTPKLSTLPVLSISSKQELSREINTSIINSVGLLIRNAAINSNTLDTRLLILLF